MDAPDAPPAYIIEHDAPTGAFGLVTRYDLADAARAWNEALARYEALDPHSDGARVVVRHGATVAYDWTRRGGRWTYTEARPS